MYWKYPLAKWVAPKKDGLYIVKHQAKVFHVGIAFKNETGKNLKEQIMYHFRNTNTEIQRMYTSPELCSVKYIPMKYYKEAVIERTKLNEKYKKRIRHIGVN